MNLKTDYMGLQLKNPIVAASSGLTSSVSLVKKLEEAGVGAVILKSLFEEQINLEVNNIFKSNELNNEYPGAQDYILTYTKSNSIKNYLNLIKNSKSEVDIPVIASINCISNSDWTSFARDIQNAGADAIELNIYEFPSMNREVKDNYEHKYIEILQSVKKNISIPVAVKISRYFSNIVRMVDMLDANGADSVTVFNRFWEPDINLDTLEISSASVMSSPDDSAPVLRWVGILSGILPTLQIAASTGIHDGKSVVKMLLAGAQVTQICSTLYLNGYSVPELMSSEIESFMKKWDFNSIEDFRGKLSYDDIPSFERYERAQFMRYFSDRKQ